MKKIQSFLNEIKLTTENIDQKKIYKLILELKSLQTKKGRLVIIGVGGSAANASHAVNDFRKLCNIDAYTPTDNVSELTARTNDEGWDTIFKGWLQTFRLNSKDKLLIFSVGGGNLKKNVSTNIIEAIKYAKKRKSKILSVVGKNDGYSYKNSDVCVFIPVFDKKKITPVSEAYQAVVWHLIVSHPILQKNKTKW
ncbi:SIS domain-containing protein [Candidatus Pelagibacter sp.]|nr:SIS domain-containing protein [Candidatus Pelagibacter sp.]